MAITLDTHTFATPGASTSHTIGHTHAANAKIVVLIAQEVSSVAIPTSVQFGGVAMSAITGSGQTVTNMRIDGFYLDSALSAGPNDLTFSLSPGAAPRVYIESMVGAATGEPESIYATAMAAATSTVIGGTVTSTSGAYVMALTANALTSRNTTGWTTLTEEDNYNAALNRSVTANAFPSAGANTVDSTWDTNQGDKVFLAVSIAEAGAAPSSGIRPLVGGVGLVGA